MPVFSPGRTAIFTQNAKTALQINGFPDFYALLEMPRDATSKQLETAITTRAADLLAASFSRGGQSELMVLLRRHITDFRPVLLDKNARFSYDGQLRGHENGDALALSFSNWQQTFANGNRLSRGLGVASRGLKAHLKTVFWDAEFL